MKNIQRSKLVNVNKIKSSKNNDNNIINSIGSSSNNFPINPGIHYKKLYDYSELINQGSSFVLNNKFNEAMETFQKALQLSEQLRDKYKINESKCNIGIVYFHLGHLNDAINYIQTCYDYISVICQAESGQNTIQNLSLLCKSGSNLCMCLITINSDDGNSLAIIDDILNIISKEEDLYEQLHCVQYLNISLFKVKSLIYNENNENYENYYNEDINNYNIKFNNNFKNNYINNNDNDEYNDINKILTNSLNNFIENENYESWIIALNQIQQKMIKLKDNNGTSYIEFNKILAIYLQNENENNYQNNDEFQNNNLKETIDKLYAFFQTLYGTQNYNEMNEEKDDFSNNPKLPPITEDYINDVILDYKLKLKSIKNIYQMLYSFEEQLDGNIQSQEYYPNNNRNIIKKKKNKKFNNDDDMQENKFDININSEYFIKLLLNYSISDFKENIRDINLRNNLINEANNTKDLIDSKKIDISKINLSSFDPEISQSLSTMFGDLLTIYRRNKLKNCFRDYKIKTRKLININPDADKKIKKFFEKQYYLIYKGENIQKINYSTSGIKTHFYQIDYENDLFESFSTDPNTNKPEKTYDFDDVLKILVGFKTKNINSKLDELNIPKKDQPYLFMSLLLRSRSIDLYFDRLDSAKKWFYGLYQYLKISKRKYKISSCTSYILFRIKCKMINQLDGDISGVNNMTISHCFKKYFRKFKNKK